MSRRFLSKKPRLEDYWRAIVLFGRNVASYKFALAKSLLELRPEAGQLVTLDELAKPFSRNIAAHLKKIDKQATSKSSKFLDACRDFNSGKVSENQLIDQTVRLGFNNVIDAFHIVGREPIEKSFFVDERKTQGGIKITDEFSMLAMTNHIGSLPAEAEARWRLVETAWSLDISTNLLSIQYDLPSNGLLAVSRENQRTVVTSCRDALNGYQKGQCFYCFRAISLSDDNLKPQVDHFFPHNLKKTGLDSLDGVWNLVLACRSCNGAGGKWANVPHISYLDRLFTRNEFWIASHHPLRETILLQTGKAESLRGKFLQECHDYAITTVTHQWQTDEVEEPTF